MKKGEAKGAVTKNGLKCSYYKHLLLGKSGKINPNSLDYETPQYSFHTKALILLIVGGLTWGSFYMLNYSLRPDKTKRLRKNLSHICSVSILT